MTREEAIKFLNEQKEFLLKGCFWEETRMNINEAFDMAIEALEADAPDTNVGDTISRQAAIDAMSEALKRVFPEHRQIAEKCLNALPSAQPELYWIPCSERLPHGSCSDLVNVSIHDDSGDTPFDYTSCGWVTTDGEYWIVDNEINNHVIAWMPLPEPWKEKRNE